MTEEAQQTKNRRQQHKKWTSKLVSASRSTATTHSVFQTLLSIFTTSPYRDIVMATSQVTRANLGAIPL